MFATSLRSARPVRRRLLSFATLLLFLASLLPAAAASHLSAPRAFANTPAPASVTIAGSLDSEIGCSGDWQPDCAQAHLTYDAADDVWQGSFALPAGDYEYKAALNDSWTENYGLHAAVGGDNIGLHLGAAQTVKFYYSHATHWVTDDVSSVIVVAPGSFQSELGCPGDWDPGCLRSWLQDPDGDGTYTLETTALPAGSYEGKAALNESWDVNYGQGGALNGANIAFTVPVDHAKVVFRYVAATHVLTVQAGHGHDNNVEWAGLRHDSRDTLYRWPGGAVPAGTPVVIRFRTFANDVTGVRIRFYSVDRAGQQIVALQRAASGVGCYEADLAAERCDFWQVTLPASHGQDNLWYRFIVTDGTATAYYADDTAALDGGLGAPTASPVDTSWALMLYKPGFTAPAWARSAVIYQIFPDRFRNGRGDNDPRTGDVRYDAPGQLDDRHVGSGSGTRRPWRRRRPQGRGPAAGLPQGPGRHHDLLQPDLRRRVQPRLRHAELPADRSLLRHPEGLGEPRQARDGSRDADPARRRVQPPEL